MNVHEEEAQLGKLYDHKLVRQLWPYLRPYWRRMLAVVLMISVVVAAQLTWPLLFSRVVEIWEQPGAGRAIRWLIAVFAAVIAIGTVADFASTYLSDSTSQHLVADLCEALYDRFQRLPLSVFDRVPGGKILARLRNDPDALRDLLETGFAVFVRNGLLILSISIMMLVLEWRLALAAFATLPIVLVITMLYRPMMRKAFRTIRALISRLNARMEENISGHATVLLLNQEKRCAAELDKCNDDLRRARVRAAMLHAFFPPLLHAAFSAGLVMVVWYGGLRVYDGEIKLGKLVAFLIYMQMFGWPLQEMMERVQLLQAAMAALERIFGFIKQPGQDLTAPAAPDPPGGVGLAPAERSRGEIEFRDVWFAYREEEWILKGLSFRAAPGEVIAIAGPTGAGKTTILSLASALYRPQKGKILLDGRDLAELDPRYVRRQVATVIQDVFLFSDTVAENVRLWEPGIDEETVRQACRRAQAADFIERHEDGYERKLGQRGADLSAGQRQLISFARALAYDPPILILDEATSSVDAETEDAIRRGLAELTHGRTSLIVAHRFSTLADADRLLVVRDGQLAEETTPKEFMKKRRGSTSPGTP